MRAAHQFGVQNAGAPGRSPGGWCGGETTYCSGMAFLIDIITGHAMGKPRRVSTQERDLLPVRRTATGRLRKNQARRSEVRACAGAVNDWYVQHNRVCPRGWRKAADLPGVVSEYYYDTIARETGGRGPWWRSFPSTRVLTDGARQALRVRRLGTRGSSPGTKPPRRTFGGRNEHPHSPARRGHHLPVVGLACPLWASPARCGITCPLWASPARCGPRLPFAGLACPLWPHLPVVGLACPLCASPALCGHRLPFVGITCPMWASPARCGPRLPFVGLACPLWASPALREPRLPVVGLTIAVLETNPVYNTTWVRHRGAGEPRV
eukprot:gene25168-biopygen19481